MKLSNESGESRSPGKKISAAGLTIKRTPDRGVGPPVIPTPSHPSLGSSSTGPVTKMDALDWNCFPDQPQRGSAPPPTVANIRHMLASAGVVVRYNVIKKKTEIIVPWHIGTDENRDNVALTHVISLATKVGIAYGPIPSIVEALADENAYNPVADWIKSKPWDGKDRLPAIYDTLTTAADYPLQLKEVLLRKWLLSAVAAALLPRFRNRGALTLQGAQGIGKGAWVGALVTDQPLREAMVKLDHHLDAYSKDSIIGAISHWITEIGELDSSLKSDFTRIKGVLTRDSDKVRRPYRPAESEYPRHTVFIATINQMNFLLDDTGNSRWWTIPVVTINYEHGIDMQQLFAQLAVDLGDGAEWWLTAEEEALLSAQNRRHRTISAVGELLMAAFDLERIGEPDLPAMTPIELLAHLGIDRPTNAQCKECAAVLREHLGDSKRINGLNKWRLPLQPDRMPRSGDPGFDKFS